MSALGFMWDAIQSSEIERLNERLTKLEEDMGIAREWIDYLSSELNKVKKDQDGTIT